MTGASTGLGEETTPCARRARCDRSRWPCAIAERGEAAAARIRAAVPDADLEVRCARPRVARRRAPVRRRVPRVARPPRPADQQRRRDGLPAGRDRRRLRAPDRHQPRRALPAHAAAGPAARRGFARRRAELGRAPVLRRRPRRSQLRAHRRTTRGPRTGGRRPPTRCSRWSSTGACATAARTRTRCTRAGSSPSSAVTSPRRRWPCSPIVPADQTIEWKTVPQGAATSVWAATAPELDAHGGAYLEDCAIAVPNPDPDPTPAAGSSPTRSTRRGRRRCGTAPRSGSRRQKKPDAGRRREPGAGGWSCASTGVRRAGWGRLAVASQRPDRPGCSRILRRTHGVSAVTRARTRATSGALGRPIAVRSSGRPSQAAARGSLFVENSGSVSNSGITELPNSSTVSTISSCGYTEPDGPRISWSTPMASHLRRASAHSSTLPTIARAVLPARRSAARASGRGSAPATPAPTPASGTCRGT